MRVHREIWQRAGIALAFAAAALPPSVCRAQDVRATPPPPVVERPYQAPGRGLVWIPGYQRWEGSRFVWVPGRWVRPPRPGAVWVPGQWRRTQLGWHWMHGHWRLS